MLEILKQKVSEQVLNSRESIVCGVYKSLIASHNSFCGCNYCIVLAKYVEMKKRLSLENRRISSPDYDFANNDFAKESIDRRKEIIDSITELKTTKNQIKLDHARNIQQ